MKNAILTLMLAMVASGAFAQEMADAMRQNGKIYVVVGVVVLMFAVLFAYLIWLDRRLKKLENEQKG